MSCCKYIEFTFITCDEKGVSILTGYELVEQGSIPRPSLQYTISPAQFVLGDVSAGAK
jgi:hypothetical protein